MFIFGAILLVFSLLSLITAIAFIFGRRETLENIRSIRGTETSTVGELQHLRDAIAKELGKGGSFREQVEVKGMIRSNNPTIAQLSQRPCVYAQMTVLETYEETYYETDNEGNEQRKTRQGSTILANSSLQINFFLEDETGRIEVNPNRANVDLIKVVDSYEQYQGNPTLYSGQFSCNVNPQTFDNKRILGYQYNEYILPVDTKVYILGEVSDSQGSLVIQHPLNPEGQFIITHKSEEQLLQEKESVAKQQKGCSIFAFGFSVFCLILGILIVFASY